MLAFCYDIMLYGPLILSILEDYEIELGMSYVTGHLYLLYGIQHQVWKSKTKSIKIFS